jgi:hypothetical protein
MAIRKLKFNNTGRELACSPMVQYLPTLYKALGLILSTEKNIKIT